MTINNIDLSTDGRFVEVWNNGNKIQQFPVRPLRLHEAVEEARQYLKEWAGDEQPDIAKALADRMKQMDADLSRMAFGAEYR